MSPRRFEHESLQSVLCNLVQESHELLSSALNLKARGLDKHLDSDYFSQTIGMFEQNNVGIRLENPIHKYVEEVLSTKDISNVNIEKLLQKVSIIVEKIDKLNDVSEQEEDYNDEKEDENDGLEYGDDQDQSVAMGFQEWGQWNNRCRRQSATTTRRNRAPKWTRNECS